MLKLRFTDINKSPVWLVEPKVIIGSSAECDVVLNELGIQPVHAEILVNYEELVFKLLADTVPVMINDRPATPHDQISINTSDRLRFGAIEMEVVDPKLVSDQSVSSSSAIRKEAAWALKANHSSLGNRLFPIAGEVVIGRAADCDISLAAAHLSRRHAQLSLRDDTLFVKDLGSSNGTFLNGKRVVEARVKRGDELRFDTLSFGVIGPADDLDKTTIRRVAPPPSVPRETGSVTAQAPRVKPVNHGLQPAAEGGKRARSKEPNTTPGSVAQAPVVAEVKRPSFVKRVVRGGTLLLIIAAGFYIVWKNNWLMI